MSTNPMLTLNGRVINIYTSPKGVNKETGEEYGGTPKIQLMCEQTLKNGSEKMELVDLNIKDASSFEENQDVSIPVGVYINGNQAKFYALK